MSKRKTISSSPDEGQRPQSGKAPVPDSTADAAASGLRARHSGEDRNALPTPSFPRKWESIGFASPKTWPAHTIGNLFDIGAGKSVTPQSRTQEPKAPFLRTSNVFWGRIDTTEVDAMHFTPEESAAKTLLPGDLLVCEGGDIGRSAIWNGELPQCSFQNHLHRLRPKRYEVVPHFFMYYLQAGFTQLGIYEGAGNKTTIPNLSRSRLASLEVPLPPKPEQQKIAAVLWKLQRAIATQDRLLAATADLKQSAMQQLFTHGLHGEPLKQTEIGPMPRSWKPTSIGSIAKLSAGGTPSRGNPEYWQDGIIPWVKTGEVDYGVILDTEEKITPLGLQNSAAKLLPKGTLLVAMYGQGVTRGKAAILGIEATTNQACAAILADKKKVRTDFLFHTLAHGYERLRGLAHGGQQQNLNADLIRGFTFARPQDTDEQRAIAAALATIDKKLTHHRAKRAALHDLFETLLHKLMTAEIRVADHDTAYIPYHLADVGKMIDRPGKASEADHVPDAGEMIRKPKGKHR
jgi:type I restriction enzyme S subunit